MIRPFAAGLFHLTNVEKSAYFAGESEMDGWFLLANRR